jgi:acetolactate synthase-1/2/3 large subunit
MIADSDAALGVGTDFDAVTTQQWTADVPSDLVHVALDPDDIGTAYEPAVGMIADAGAALSRLTTELQERGVIPKDGTKRAQEVRKLDRALLKEAASVTAGPLTSAGAELALDDALPDSTIVAVDAGGFRIWALYAIQTAAAGEFIDTGSWATMGTALPAAIGAKVAHPDRPVVALVGDGGLLMSMQELHTAAVEDIPVVTVVLNNSDYATISAEAADSFQVPEGSYEWDGTPVRFADLARSIGVESFSATAPTDIRSTITDALELDRPSLIEIPTDPQEPQAKPLD